jgi:dTDP-glucose pyrophosphorylase
MKNDALTLPNRPILVVPLAGTGSMLADSRFSPSPDFPKALITVCGRPMIWWVLLDLRRIPLSKIVFVILNKHEQMHNVSLHIQQTIESSVADGMFRPSSIEFVFQKEPLKGQLLSVLEARSHIEGGRGLLIASCDTFVASCLSEDILKLESQERGLLSVVERNAGEQWSFVRIDKHNRVKEVAEKERISKLASTGIYYFSDGQEFLAAAEATVKQPPATAGEYYVIPVYREYLNQNKLLKTSQAMEMWDMGESQALECFLGEMRNAFLRRIPM